MTEVNAPQTTGKGASKSPSFIAFQVRDRDGKPDYWNRIGVAFNHGDGKGFNLQLESVPLNGRIVIRIAPEE